MLDAILEHQNNNDFGFAASSLEKAALIIVTSPATTFNSQIKRRAEEIRRSGVDVRFY